MSASTSADFETSQTIPSTVKPLARMSLIVGVSHSSRRAHSMRHAPASASPSAISCPNPREPPVTMATRPVRLNNSLMLGTWQAYTARPPGCQRLSTRELGSSYDSIMDIPNFRTPSLLHNLSLAHSPHFHCPA